MPTRTRTMSLAAVLATAALAAVTACSSNAGSSAGPGPAGGNGSTPAAVPSSAAAAAGAPKATVAQGGSDDVTIDSCAIDATTKIPQAELTVTNHGSDLATYTIQIDFVDGGGTWLAEGAAIAHSLAAGQRAKETAGGTAQVASDVTCKLADVKRLAGM
ncbi:hypothetical protein ACFYNO_23675 [Kitasatospora sp. NPDC006697]|uniref:hypothetical protein n=1 Tax=Kitasatospora sp. NPDC006697 TaxID=3364020 RepID=UPI003693DFEA